MSTVIPITGEVTYSITLDPSVWIFDDRKISYEDFSNDKDNVTFDKQTDEIENGQLGIREGAAAPPIRKSVRRYKKKDWLNESFVMPAKFFLGNAEPSSTAKTIVFELDNGGSASVSISDVETGVFAFSKDGMLLQENGPIHFHQGNDSALERPIKGIRKIIVQ